MPGTENTAALLGRVAMSLLLLTASRELSQDETSAAVVGDDYVTPVGRFARDSPVEGDGFELSVPRGISFGFRGFVLYLPA